MRDEITAATIRTTIETNQHFMHGGILYDDLLDKVVDVKALPVIGKKWNPLIENEQAEPGNELLIKELRALARHAQPQEALAIVSASLKDFEDKNYYHDLRVSSYVCVYMVKIASFSYPDSESSYAFAMFPDWWIRTLALSVSSAGEMHVFQSLSGDPEIYTPEQILNWKCLHTRASQQESAGKDCHYPLT